MVPQRSRAAYDDQESDNSLEVSALQAALSHGFWTLACSVPDQDRWGENTNTQAGNFWRAEGGDRNVHFVEADPVCH
jgi:hypothetical protein